MSVAKKERRRILRIKRSRQAKAEQGSFVGGRPGLGYKLVYQNGKRGDLAIDENEAETVRAFLISWRHRGTLSNCEKGK
jgi:DNA invertase Pin-like site-specific DNA recombinase